MNNQFYTARDLNFGDILYMLKASLTTIELALIAIIGGMLLGIIIGIGRSSSNTLLKMSTKIYVEFFRGIPILLQIFIFYYGLKIFDIKLPALLSASIAFIFNVSANIGETLKGIILSIPKNQWESSTSLGFSKFAQLWYIILPQVIRAAIPPTIGIMVGLIKDTSLASIVGFIELTRSGGLIMSVTMDPFIIYPIIAIIYFVICFFLTQTSRWLEKKVN
jgi:polar amino acid transport system permease protein